MHDTIRIHRLRAEARIGVPDEERASPQEVEFCLRLVPQGGLAGLGDDVARTVDYYVVSQRILELAASGERKLLETLAEEVATALLAEFPLAEVGVEARKFILPETAFVSVEITRKP